MLHRIRNAGRYLGWAFLVLALLAFGGALQPWIQGEAFSSLALSELWFRLDAESFNSFQAGAQRYIHPSIWEYGAMSILLQPAWLVFAVVGSLLAWFLRRT